MNAEHIKEILKASINSAIGVDDEFVEPYSVDCNKDEFKTSSELFQAFHRDLNCTLFLFRYTDYESFSLKASSLLNNKDLLLLDWQLRGAGSDALEDIVKIIDRSVSQDSPIRFIVIYTAAPDLYSLSRDLYVAFAGDLNNKLDLDTIKERVDGILTSCHEDLDIDALERIARANLSNCLLQENLKESRKAFNKAICKQLSDETKRELKPYLNQLDEILLFWEMSLCSEAAKLIECPSRKVQVLDEDVLLIENTAVFLVTKQGFSPDQLVNHLCDKLTILNNWRSLLLSLKFKELFSMEVAFLGKGLGGFNDSTLMQYLNPGEASSTIESLTNCFNVQVGDILRKIDKVLLDELWARDVKCGICDEEELGRLVSFLSYNRRRDGDCFYQINTGDVFVLKGQHLFHHEKEEEYLMCITQGCDCLHPSKVYNNFAFVVGEKVSRNKALRHMQDDIYTIVDDEESIKWENRFLTIHLPENRLRFSKSLTCQIVVTDQKGDLESKSVEMVYLGRQKEIYAQRVINAVFSHAMRIGSDLPEWNGA